MNTEDSEFERIEREQAMRGVPDAIHHTDTSESLEYITGWNDCRQAMLAAPATYTCGACGVSMRMEQPAQQEPVYHLKQYGDVTKEQLDQYMATGDINPQPAQQEPFGYFKAEPFGWTDCAETDEGAVALYTTPPAQPAQKRPQNCGTGYCSCIECVMEPAQQEPVGCQWTPCMKLPVVVHVRKQYLGEAHVSTREGITPVKPDDLIMRGVSGEEYPIGRAIFEQTYTLDTTPQAPKEKT